ncbi:MAG: hypothetical protein A2751_03875 [Candidatus Doudnabacteria bacterium RIFCSPHIGHO2_01_FULL_46_14]|uniref:Uncharacterized protein n=1 Tax=Candidatus Doudnabacteria bacterium RIFCSPHIGHO2_01_FULL_46_14 TaxID=1817824 RepID=A0A1F5NL37_9BACT|nr:MAG: hypothetical protein A2751_03875 [Candidatus Doudnabacteria bacterium RIFCSPHIGHO2_01_FULL_46_14]
MEEFDRFKKLFRTTRDSFFILPKSRKLCPCFFGKNDVLYFVNSEDSEDTDPMSIGRITEQNYIKNLRRRREAMLYSRKIRETVQTQGFTTLAWALSLLVTYGHDTLASMIICCLCVCQRKTEEENNGVMAALTSKRLRESVGKNENMMFSFPMILSGWFAEHHDKIVVTLHALWPNLLNVGLNRNQPLLWRRDGTLVFYPKKSQDPQVPNSIMLWSEEKADEAELGRTRFFKGTEFSVLVYSNQIDESRMEGWKVVGGGVNGVYSYEIPDDTIVFRFGREFDGRRLSEIFEFRKQYLHDLSIVR